MKISYIATAAIISSGALMICALAPAARSNDDDTRIRNQMKADTHQYVRTDDHPDVWEPSDANLRKGAMFMQPGAEQVALQHLPGGKIISTNLETHRLRPAYLIKVRQDGKIKEASVDAMSGAFLGINDKAGKMK